MIADLDPGLPPLVGRLLSFHPFMCSLAGCREVVAWLDPTHPRLGFCEGHRWRFYRETRPIPIAIFGRENEGWEVWPIALARYFILRDRGAIA